MVSYAKLADNAKRMQDAGKPVADMRQELRVDPSSFFGSVKANLVEEMKKANAELHRRGVAAIEQNHLPGFDTDVCLTFGTDLLCRVGVGIRTGEYRITAVLCGPPNGYEISRKEYLCPQVLSNQGVSDAGGVGMPPVMASPREIAVHIISSILAGKFN